MAFDTVSDEWSAALHPNSAPATRWTGPSGIPAHGDKVHIVERDNRIGAAGDALTVAVTDNDGADDGSGETRFSRLGPSGAV